MTSYFYVLSWWLYPRGFCLSFIILHFPLWAAGSKRKWPMNCAFSFSFFLSISSSSWSSSSSSSSSSIRPFFFQAQAPASISKSQHEAQFPAWRFKTQPGGSKLSLEPLGRSKTNFKTPDPRFKFQTQCSNLTLVAQIPDSRFKSPVLRLKSQPL